MAPSSAVARQMQRRAKPAAPSDTSTSDFSVEAAGRALGPHLSGERTRDGRGRHLRHFLVKKKRRRAVKLRIVARVARIQAAAEEKAEDS